MAVAVVSSPIVESFVENVVQERKMVVEALQAMSFCLLKSVRVCPRLAVEKQCCLNYG